MADSPLNGRVAKRSYYKNQKHNIGFLPTWYAMTKGILEGRMVLNLNTGKALL
jgi:hypothetical protein